MPPSPDDDSAAPGGLAVVSADAVTRALLTGLAESLDLHPAVVVDTLVAAQGKLDGIITILLDGDDLPTAAALRQGLPGFDASRVIVVGNNLHTLPTGPWRLLNKPATRASLAAALAPPNTDTAFDRTTTDELIRLFGADGVREMASTLRRDLGLKQEELNGALANADHATVRQVAHGLLGVAQQLDARDFAQQCRKLELSALSQDSTRSLFAAVESLLQAYQGLVEQLEGVLNEG